jgi:hypothetical protein
MHVGRTDWRSRQDWQPLPLRMAQEASEVVASAHRNGKRHDVELWTSPLEEVGVLCTKAVSTIRGTYKSKAWRFLRKTRSSSETWSADQADRSGSDERSSLGFRCLAVPTTKLPS